MQSLLVLLAGLMLTSSLQSQSAIGGKMGIHLSKWTGEDGDFYGPNSKYAVGTQAGLVFQIGINDMISIQPELLLLQKGVRVKTSYSFSNFGDEINFEGITRFNYLEVPILVKLNFPIGEQLSVFLNVGPSIGYVLNGVSLRKQDSETEKGDFMFNDQTGYNRFDTSIAVGGGIGYDLPFGKLLLEVRYLYGLLDVNDRIGIEVKNRGVGATLGFMLPF